MSVLSTVGALSSQGFGQRVGFTPLQLFLGGEQGGWYDPSDFSTLFQDSAGTTAVTTFGQPVGKVLDKSGRGNHLIQATSASRPTVQSRLNLLTYSEQMDNAAWAKDNTTVVANDTTSWTGQTTADLVKENTVNDTHQIYQTYSVLATSYTVTVYAKWPSGVTRNLSISGGGSNALGNNKGVIFDSTGAFVAIFNATGADPTYTSESLGNGWYKFTVTTSITTAGTAYPSAGLVSGTTRAYAGDGTSGIWFGGMDYRIGTASTAFTSIYQKVVTATDYDDMGFPRYFQFDGVDDALYSSANVDLSGTNKVTVYSGVRKLSDAALGVVSELSATIASNNGTFLLSAPNSAAANYNFSSKGTTQVNNTVTTYAAPTPHIVTGLGDIGAPSNVIRVNGTQAASVTTSQGTGNYGSFVLNVGRRNNASSPFNGHLYQLIVRGAASSGNALTDGERFVAYRSGITL